MPTTTPKTAHTSVDWDNVTDKPETFPSEEHGHTVGEIVGLSAQLDFKSEVGHSHVISDTTDLQTTLDGKAATSHTHAISNVTGLQSALDGKATSSHSHAISDTTGLQAALDAKAASSHAHAISDTTGLQAALDSKASATHTHSVTVNAPSRSIVTSTSSTGFQVSLTRSAIVCYEGVIQTTSTIGGPASGSVFLETADTNSTTPGDWTKIAEQTSSQTITLAIALQSVDGEAWSLTRVIPAGKYVRIRSQTNSGAVSISINANQQETIL